MKKLLTMLLCLLPAGLFAQVTSSAVVGFVVVTPDGVEEVYPGDSVVRPWQLTSLEDIGSIAHDSTLAGASRLVSDSLAARDDSLEAISVRTQLKDIGGLAHDTTLAGAARIAGDSLARIDATLEANLSDSMVFWLDVAASDRDTVRDGSPEQNHGVPTNFDWDATVGGGSQQSGYVWAPELGQMAASFDSVNSVIVVPDNARLDLLNGGTITVWTKPKSVGEVYGRLFEKKGTWRAYIYNSTQLRVALDGIQPTQTLSGISLNKWNFVAMRFDGANIYLTINQSTVTAAHPYLPPDSAGNLYIGSNYGGDRSFDGLIADLRIYDRRILTDAQISALYQRGPKQFAQGGYVTREQLNALQADSMQAVGGGDLTVTNPGNHQYVFSVDVTAAAGVQTYYPVTIGPAGTNPTIVYNGTNLTDSLALALSMAGDSAGKTVWLYPSNYVMKDSAYVNKAGVRLASAGANITVAGDADFALMFHQPNSIIEGINWIGTDSCYGIAYYDANADSGGIRDCSFKQFNDPLATIIGMDTLAMRFTFEQNVLSGNTGLKIQGASATVRGNRLDKHTKYGMLVNFVQARVIDNTLSNMDSCGIILTNMGGWPDRLSHTMAAGGQCSGNMINFPDTASSHIGIFIRENIANHGMYGGQISDNQITTSSAVVADYTAWTGDGIRLETVAPAATGMQRFWITDTRGTGLGRVIFSAITGVGITDLSASFCTVAAETSGDWMLIFSYYCYGGVTTHFNETGSGANNAYSDAQCWTNGGTAAAGTWGTVIP